MRVAHQNLWNCLRLGGFGRAQAFRNQFSGFGVTFLIKEPGCKGQAVVQRDQTLANEWV